MPLPHEKRRSPWPYPMLFERFTYGSPSNPMGSPYPFKSLIRYVKLLTLCRTIFFDGVYGEHEGEVLVSHGVTHGVTHGGRMGSHSRSREITLDADCKFRVR